MNQQELKELEELDLEIEKNLEESLQIQKNNHSSLRQQNQELDQIEQEGLVKVENRVKKGKWLIKSAKKPFQWFKSLFSTPDVKKIERREQNSQKEYQGDALDQIGGMVRDEGEMIHQQKEKLDRIDQKMKKLNQDIDYINHEALN